MAEVLSLLRPRGIEDRCVDVGVYLGLPLSSRMTLYELLRPLKLSLQPSLLNNFDNSAYFIEVW